MSTYRGSTAMITGASKGLGAAFAKELAGRGMNLVLVARSIDTLQALADSLGAQYGVRCVVLQADLATSDAVNRIVTELERLDLKIDLLDSAELVVRRTLLSFDQKNSVAYPGRFSVRVAIWLPRLLPRNVMVSAAASATGKMGLAT
jgi:uncharacterized protein